MRGAFASLDDVNLEEFDERACVVESVPRFMGPYRIAMRVALEEMNTTDEVRTARRVTRAESLVHMGELSSTE